MSPQVSSPIWLFLSAAVVLLLPGAVLLAWLPGGKAVLARPHRDLLSVTADAVGLSISIEVVLALWLFFTGVKLPQMVTALVFGGAFALLIIGLLWKSAAILRSYTRAEWLIAVPLALVFLAALLALRFYQARDLAFPPWVDSVHHTLIVQKILETGSLPEDYLPYINAAFFYHYGFHLITALFSAWSHLPAAQSALWFGQVLNACVSLSVYRITFALGDVENRPRRIIHALLAALLVGVAFHMPAYYLTWGRYTLLSGLILLGPAMAAVVDLWDDPHRPDAWVRLALLVAGLCLTHYFAMLLAALFIVVVGFFLLDQVARDRAGWAALLRTAAASLIGVLLAAPWLVRVWMYNQRYASVAVVDPLDQSPNAVKRAADYFNYLSVLLGPHHNHLLLGMAGAGFLVSLRRQRMRPLVIWALLLVLFTMPWGLRLGPFRPDHFAIILFFPAGILLAELLVAGSEAVGSLFQGQGRQWAALITVTVVTALFLVWGYKETKDIVNAATVIANKADAEALDWVKANTPSDARFFINSTSWFYSTYRGVDGGYWIEPYTGRTSLMPPALYSWSPKEDFQRINGWAVRSGKLTGCTADFWAIVREADLNYVYIREGAGQLQPAMLVGCSELHPVYERNGVHIYEISRAVP